LGHGKRKKRGRFSGIYGEGKRSPQVRKKCCSRLVEKKTRKKEGTKTPGKITAKQFLSAEP